MTLVASDRISKQVANERSINEVTVKIHRGSLMRKLGTNRSDAHSASRGEAPTTAALAAAPIIETHTRVWA